MVIAQWCDPPSTWGGWSRVLQFLHKTNEECRTDLMWVQMNSSAPLQNTPSGQILCVAVWCVKRLICHSWWQRWVCVYTPLLLFSWNVHRFTFCCLFVCLICWIFPSFSWGEMFSPAHSSCLGERRRWEQLCTWVIWINVIEKKSGIGTALGMSGVNPRIIRCSAWISSEIINKCFV